MCGWSQRPRCSPPSVEIGARRLLAGLALLAVIAIAFLRSITSSDSDLLLTMLRDVKKVNLGSLIAIGLGVSTAVPWLFLRFPRHRVPCLTKRSISLLLLGLSLAFIAPAVGAIVYRDYRESQHKTPYKVAPRCFDRRFSAAAVVSFADGNEPEAADAYPICVAVDENDNVFVSLQLKGEDDYSGRIFQLLPGQGSNQRMRLKTVADSPCLFRTFGLAVRGGEIFVSRSGFLAHARKGRIEYENSGAITRLRDLDRDGMMDYYEDVVTGLPGSQGPVSQHSNNGIVFGSDGSLYFTQGVHSDRDVVNHPWEGKILRANPDFQKVTVFASGLRNPFGLVLGPGGELFATDNDVTLGNPGDELNLIKEGADYGHPHVVGNDDGGGQFTKPLLLSGQGNFTGITYTESSALPEDYRGCLYVADFIGHKVWRITLTPDGGSYSAKATPFVEVPFPIGVAVTRTGVFYITSYEGVVFRVRIDTTPTENRQSRLVILLLAMSLPAIVSILSTFSFRLLRSPNRFFGPPIKTAQDFDRGRQLFFEIGCSRCHSIDGAGQRRFGPPLHEIGMLAADRKPGMTAPQYILESILDPGAFRAPGVSGGMPGGIFTSGKDDLRQLVGFLATRGATVGEREIEQLDVPEIHEVRNADAPLDYVLVRRGEAIFRGKGQCIACHPLRPDAGSNLMAPSLLSVGSLSAEELRRAIEEPNVRVAAGYQHVRVYRKDGRVVEGRFIEKNDEGIDLLRADPSGGIVSEFVPFCDMDCSEDQTQPMYVVGRSSIMPDMKGVLIDEEINALVAFLKNRHSNR